MKTVLATAGISISLLLVLPGEAAAAIRISFLTEPTALKDTIGVLRSGGCTKQATETFARVVERFNSSKIELDLGKFPKPQAGFYVFESASDLVAALPHQLADTQHAYEFNCFDTIISVAGESLRSTVRPDEISGPYLVPHTLTNGSFAISSRATARDAYTLVYTDWYRTMSEEALPKPKHAARIALTASLFRCQLLRESTTEEGLGSAVLEALTSSWARQGMTFPHQFQVVLVHEVNLPGRLFVTAHAGLLFPRKRSFTYIEKAGGSGPFVRLDLDDRAELLTWFGAMFRGGEKFGYTHHFATFNGAGIESITTYPNPK